MIIPSESKKEQRLLPLIIQKLERGSTPSNKWPDSRGEYWALCPFHNDHKPGSFSMSENGFNCFACGAKGGLSTLAKKIGISPKEQPNNAKTSGISLEEYAQAKKLPVDFLKDLGITARNYQDRLRIGMPYLDQNGQQVTSKYRYSLNGKHRFSWQKGSSIIPYGIWLLDELLHSCTEKSGDKQYIFLVEGESDAQTLWFYNIPALGIPGVNTWHADWAKYVKDKEVYIWKEPDQGGEAFVERIGENIPDAQVVNPPRGRKDISECHVLGDDVPQLLQDLRRNARPYRETAATRLNDLAKKAFESAKPILSSDILNNLVKLCKSLGLVGEERLIKLIYLIVTSRLLERPISLVIKGPSSGGKSFVTQKVLEIFPPSAYYSLTGMSEKALAYSRESLVHRMLVIYEASGISSDFASYLMRSLLSEGHIRYETVVKTADGYKSKLIEREGPTGAILTTTKISLHPENETRLFSITDSDDMAQTRGILESLASNANVNTNGQPDLKEWHALQTWLELGGNREVSIPFAVDLATLTDPAAVRIRRDFGAILNLIKSHAILHQFQRSVDEHERIVATLDDYRAVHNLVVDIVSEGVETSVSKSVRHTVETVMELLEGKPEGTTVSQAELVLALDLDKSSVSRRVRQALKLEYLVNLEDKRGKPHKLVLGNPLPEDKSILPSPDELEKYISGIPPQTTATVQHPINQGEVTDLTEIVREHLDSPYEPDTSKPCFACGQLGWRERPPELGGGPYCAECHPS